MKSKEPNFTIIKPEQQGGWTMLWNDYVIRNRELDANEKEMLCVLLSFENGTGDICKKMIYYYCSPSNSKTNDKTFNSLKRKGHLKLIKNVDALNHKIWWDYEIYQKPLDTPVEQYETRYTTAPDKMLRKASPDVVAQLAEKYGIDASVIEQLHADLVGNAPTAPAQQDQEETAIISLYNQLSTDSTRLQEIVNKYELTEEELKKHLENFSKNKKSFAHKEYEAYREHFERYVGKCLTDVKKVVKARQKTKATTPAPKTDFVPQSDNELLQHTRKIYADIKEVREELPFSEYREQVDLFIKHAQDCEKRGISNDVLIEIRTFYQQLRSKPGELKKYYDSQLQISDNVLKEIMKVNNPPEGEESS